MVYAYQNWQQGQLLKGRQFFRVSFILIFVHHSLMTINFKLSFIPTPALQIWFSFYVFFIFIFGFKLRGACSVNLSPRLVKEWQFLLPFCNACWQWLDRIRGTINTPCPYDKHTGIISGVFRNSKKVYATHSEKFFFQYFCHMIGSKLVEIETEKENNFLKNHARSEHQHGTALKLPERFVF